MSKEGFYAGVEQDGTIIAEFYKGSSQYPVFETTIPVGNFGEFGKRTEESALVELAEKAQRENILLNSTIPEAPTGCKPLDKNQWQICLEKWKEKYSD